MYTDGDFAGRPWNFPIFDSEDLLWFARERLVKSVSPSHVFDSHRVKNAYYSHSINNRFDLRVRLVLIVVSWRRCLRGGVPTRSRKLLGSKSSIPAPSPKCEGVLSLARLNS